MVRLLEIRTKADEQKLIDYINNDAKTVEELRSFLDRVPPDSEAFKALIRRLSEMQQGRSDYCFENPLFNAGHTPSRPIGKELHDR